MLCVLLAVICLCTSALAYAHCCLEEGGAMHVSRCTDDCCAVCTFINLMMCVLLFVGSRFAVCRMIWRPREHRSASPEMPEGTLVQLKVKLSD